MTTPYNVQIAPSILDTWDNLQNKQQKTLCKLIEALAVNPRPPSARKVTGMTGLYAQEIDQLRLIYKVEDQEVWILLIKQ